MSVNIEYKCDVCRSIVQKQDILAVHFANMKDFKLLRPNCIGFDDHKGVHICKRCLKQLKDAE